jgi:transmembrane sensor
MTVEQHTNRASRAARAEASVWIVRLHSEKRTPQLEADLREWLAADPENARQFERITDVWDLGGVVSVQGLPRMRSWQAPTWRRHGLLAMAGVMVCAIALLTFYWWWYASAYVTAHGEQRLVYLDDGSRVHLNSDSRLRIEFATNERRVRLHRGEGLFEVAPDARRPFIVEAGAQRVTALGTTFVVRFESARTAIILVEGRVAVSQSSDTAAAELRPGERLTFAKVGPPEVDMPRLEAVTAWRRGEVLLEDTRLDEAIAEMNRYDKRLLVIDDAELAAVRVSGVYRTGDSVGFARAVAELHGFQVRDTAGQIHLHKTRAH